MSVGEIAALIAACAAALVALFLVVTLVKLMRTLDTATQAVKKLSDRVEPILSELESTIAGVNTQLVKVDAVTDHVASLAGSVATVTSLVTGAVTNPIVKVASLVYGLRKAAGSRRGDGAASTEATAPDHSTNRKTARRKRGRG
ncbi:MAG TPA: DUF948 domain-containing protein [Mycobacteriales bacterium]|nr:DUF948 domain-containing protein [Mycobacteriales bacterium]